MGKSLTYTRAHTHTIIFAHTHKRVRTSYTDACMQTHQVARLREAQTDKKTPMILKTDMSSGHFSASDRYKLMEERSIEYAFVVEQLGCPDLLPIVGKDAYII